MIGRAESAAITAEAGVVGVTVETLARRYRFGNQQGHQLAALLEVLRDDPHAPTTVRDPAGASERHLADSLVALEVDRVRSARKIVDLGSGAGFPGLALAVALPAANVSLVESAARKCAFIASAIAHAGIVNARAECVRAEEWPDGRQRHDLATARAVGASTVVAEYAAPLLGVGGALLEWRGRRSRVEERDALRACAILGLERVEIRHVQPFPTADNRHLHLYLKVRATPERFPRRSGMAVKRPL